MTNMLHDVEPPTTPTHSSRARARDGGRFWRGGDVSGQRRDWSIKYSSDGWDMTLTYKRKDGWRRMLTVDTRMIPQGAHEAQQWFLVLLGRIWWDISDTESFAVTTRTADEMVIALKRHREAIA